MRYLKLMLSFARASAQNTLAHRANFWISLLHSLLNLSAAVMGVAILFGQVQALRGWTFASTLALLGTYLTLEALYHLVVGPSLEAMAGMEGEIWTGRFDYVLLRPVDTQFQASVRHWQPLALIDLALGLGVLGLALWQLGTALTLAQAGTFILMLTLALIILYAILLSFTALLFWSPGFLFTWLFDSLFQMARYPVELYPAWLRLPLTWIIPVGLLTTLPAQALSQPLPLWVRLGALLLAGAWLGGASWLFRTGLRRYHSASS